MALSSNRLGHHSFKVEIRVRVSVALQKIEMCPSTVAIMFVVNDTISKRHISILCGDGVIGSITRILEAQVRVRSVAQIKTIINS